MLRFFAALTALFWSGIAYAQSCTPGTIQTGLVPFTSTSPLCTSVVSNFDIVNQSISGGTTTGTLVPSAIKGMYGIRLYASTATTNSLAAITIQLGWTEGGIARTLSTAPNMSLLTLGNNISAPENLYVDAGTAITYSVTVVGTAGSYNLHIDGRPPQV